MIEVVIDATFDAWQERARVLIAAGVHPGEVIWSDHTAQALLPVASGSISAEPAGRVAVPRRFVDLARRASCHRAGDRWALLYRLLWRLVHVRRDLLDDELDADVARLKTLVQQVQQDEHRMQAFVRFRPVGSGADERLVAWYVPDYDIAARVAPHFAARYPNTAWSILTPYASVHHLNGRIAPGPGVPAPPAVDSDDAAEVLWRVYYGAVFNPARVNPQKLARDMPARHRGNLPEARDIPQLVAGAAAQAEAMRAASGGSTRRAAVPATMRLDDVKTAAAGCRNCPLHERATQTVFGEGPRSARLMLIGEQPGDVEDRRGRPFVGPAGELLDRALATAGLSRQEIYLTNAVKHFGWEPRGKRRIHRTPRLSEIQACRPWLERELALVRPAVIVLLGGVAARALLGPQARVAELRGTPQVTGLAAAWAPTVIVTFHPSAVLRTTEAAAQQQAFDLLAEDLRLAARAVASPQASGGALRSG